MIKLMLFSCVLITLVNFSFSEPIFEQFVDGNNVEHLRLRLRRSTAGKSLFSSSMSAPNPGTGSNAAGGGGGASTTGGVFDAMKEFAGQQGASHFLTSTMKELAEKMTSAKNGEPPIKQVMNAMDKYIKDMNIGDKPASSIAMLMEPTKQAMKNLLNNSGEGANKGNSFSQLFSSDTLRSNAAQV